MRSAGGGRRKAGKAEAVVSPVTGAAAPAAEDVDGQRKTAREEAGDGDAAAVEELGNEGLTGGDDEEDDDDEEEDDNGVEEEKVEERPKLADGFYEIEDIRKKRMRKGQIQFLIKWSVFFLAPPTFFFFFCLILIAGASFPVILPPLI